MSNKSLVNWLIDFCDQLEGVEKIVASDNYAQGLHDGARITQDGIAKKLRYAAEQEKKRLTKRAADKCCLCGKKSGKAHICSSCLDDIL